MPSPPPCKALAMLARWIEQNAMDTAKLSRRLDLSWETTRRILDGESRPDVDVVLALFDLAKIPLESWRVMH